MNRLEKISLVAIASLAVFGTTVFGTTGKVYNTSQGLVLRAEASKTGAPLATVANNTEVEIIEEDGEWYKVNANGKEGYLYAEYVEIIKTEEEPISTTESPIEPESENSNQENPNNNEKRTVKIETNIYLMPVISSSVIGTIPTSTEITIEKELNNWSYVSYGDIKGWIRTYNINEEVIAPQEESGEKTTEVTPNEVEPNETITTSTPGEDTNLSFTKGYVNSESVNVRSNPDKSSSIVTTLILNTGVTITAQTDEWYKITYGDYTGYIFKTLISQNLTTTSRGGETRAPEVTTNNNTNNNNDNVTSDPKPQVNNEQVTNNTSSQAGEKIVSFAKQYLGYSYVYGGTTPSGGFDCSGFVYYVFNSCGYSLSRSCSVQANSGTAISKANLQPGDIVFFNNTSNGSIGHVGIYIGDGRFIHAANSRRGVVTDTLNSGYYNTYYYSARRVAN